MPGKYIEKRTVGLNNEFEEIYDAIQQTYIEYASVAKSEKSTFNFHGITDNRDVLDNVREEIIRERGVPEQEIFDTSCVQKMFQGEFTIQSLRLYYFSKQEMHTVSLVTRIK